LLGLEPTGDKTEVRRAYRTQLRTIDPDNDPAAFIALRQAFEEALKWTPEDYHDDQADDEQRFETWKKPSAAKPDDVPANEPERTPPEGRPQADSRGEDRKLIAAFDRATQNRRATEAEPLFNAIMARGIAELGAETTLIEQFLTAALRDLNYPAARLEDYTKRLLTPDFVRADEKLTQLHDEIHKRLEAETWYASLRDQAGARWLWSWKKRQQRRVARLFLKQRWQGVFLRVNGTMLDRALVQYRAHLDWMVERLDGAWMARIERKRKRQLRRGLYYAWAVLAFLGLDVLYVVGRGFITGNWN
jgi:hypothetical protein